MTEYLISLEKYLEKTAAPVGPIGAATTVINAPGALEKLVDAAKKFVKIHPGWTGVLAGAAGLGGLGYLGYRALQQKQQAREQDKIFAQVRNSDPVLEDADHQELATAFGTMKNFAPTLATDPNAVRSFLRSAVMSGGGVDYNTIKLLAETENAATGRFRKD